jgi:hypothetical protein
MHERCRAERRIDVDPPRRQMLWSFEFHPKRSWTYERNGDRLVVSRYETNDRSDGVGRHEASHTLEVVRLE